MSNFDDDEDEVEYSQEGMVKNILSLNYTLDTVIKEYLNNVLSKNDNPDYEIIFNIREFRSNLGFEFMEKDAIGFTSLNEIKKAFKIADSHRNGTNNIGYGIYSPITLNKGYDACNLFIQNNDSGRFYSLTMFNSDSSRIKTRQGEYTDQKIEGIDISTFEVVGGTRSIWFTIPEINIDEAINGWKIYILKLIIKNYIKFEKVVNTNTDTLITDIKNIGKYYHDYIDKGVKISYGDNEIEAYDILHSDNNSTMKKSYHLSIISDSGSFEYRIKEDELDDWSKFTLSSTKPIGDSTTRRSQRTGEQKAILRIHDVDLPGDKREQKERIKDKKIWVKVTNGYIFNEDFPLNGWPNIRVVLELTNTDDNNFDHYISTNANKSNSLVNKAVKDRISSLVKYVKNNHFNGGSNRSKPIPKAMQQQVWLKTFGENFKHDCYVSWCKNVINVWDFHTGHNIPLNEGGPTGIDNLKPICAPCNTGMGCDYTIDSWIERGEQ